MDKNTYRTNVHYAETEYFYSKNCVVCKLRFYIDTENLPGYAEIDNDNHLWARFTKLLSNIKDLELVNDKTLVFNVTSIAKCNDEDTYDKTKGEHIALTKCQRKAFTIAEIVYNICIEMMSEVLATLYAVREKQLKCIYNATNHLNKLYK